MKELEGSNKDREEHHSPVIYQRGQNRLELEKSAEIFTNQIRVG